MGSIIKECSQCWQMFKSEGGDTMCNNCSPRPEIEYQPLTKKDIKICPWCSKLPKYTKKKLIKPCECYFKNIIWEDKEDGVSIYVWNKACQEQLGIICYSLGINSFDLLQKIAIKGLVNERS